MKSLEILNWFIDALGGFSDGRILVEKEELEQIKQDLEVLEILKKYLKIKRWGSDKYQTVDINIRNVNFGEDEHFNKVKQWLEVNENEEIREKTTRSRFKPVKIIKINRYF